MSYQLRYEPRAARHIENVPHDLLDALERNLVLLARNPVGLSERVASPPFPPRGQLYHFHTVNPPGAVFFFTVIFQYSQDETSLHILSVTWRELPEE